MMALWREVKSFKIAPQTLDKFGKRFSLEVAAKSRLFVQNSLGLDKIVGVAGALEDEIKTMDRNSSGLKEFSDGLETCRQGSRFEVFEHRVGKDHVERFRRQVWQARPKVFPDDRDMWKLFEEELVIRRASSDRKSVV